MFGGNSSSFCRQNLLKPIDINALRVLEPTNTYQLPIHTENRNLPIPTKNRNLPVPTKTNTYQIPEPAYTYQKP